MTFLFIWLLASCGILFVNYAFHNVNPRDDNMNRTDPTFKEQNLIEQENLEFIDELYNNPYDCDGTSNDYENTSNFSTFDR
jgi:hypothetical protein